MKKIEIYSKNWCPFCAMAKSLLKSEGLEYKELDVTNNPALEQEMNQRSQQYTVPQVFIDNQPLGGFDDLYQLQSTGELVRLTQSLEKVAQ